MFRRISVEELRRIVSTLLEILGGYLLYEYDPENNVFVSTLLEILGDIKEAMPT